MVRSNNIENIIDEKKIIENIIDEKKIYEYGVEWTDAHWNERKRYVMPDILKSSMLSYWAGKWFVDSRFSEFEKEIAGKVAEHLWFVYQSSTRWNDHRFNENAKKLLENLEVMDFYNIGLECNNNKFNFNKERICEGVIRDNRWYKLAIKGSLAYNKWEEDRREFLKEFKEKRSKLISENDGNLSLGENIEQGRLSQTEIGLAIVENDIKVVEKNSPWYKRIFGK